MTTTERTGARNGGSSRAPAPWWRRPETAPVAVVALLAVGALAGAVGWDLVDDEGAERPSTPVVSSSTTAAPDDAAGGVEPRERAVCIDALEGAVEALDLVDAGVTALGELSRDELERVLDGLEALRPGLRRSAEDCQDILRE